MRTIKYGRSEFSYSRHRSTSIDGPEIRLINYRQQDPYSCGFMAALSVVKYFRPKVTELEVFKAVRPSINYGVDRFKLLGALERLGIQADYRCDLSTAKLIELVNLNLPTIISVWPEEYVSDHWTVVRGFSRTHIYLTNYRDLPIDLLGKEWSDMDMRSRGGSAEGIVCVGTRDGAGTTGDAP